MINPQLLTEANGFEDGVVVEIVWDNGEIVYEPFDDSWVSAGYYDESISIRPLTGPMSIWNHAPEWADYATIEEMGVFWWRNSKYPKSITLTARPFWATGSGE